MLMVMSMKFSPSPSNINYFWNLGFLMIVIFMVQLVSGIFISFHYNSMMEYSFFSTVHISREVFMGWLVRLIHINGASMFFFLIFSHILKNILNGSWMFVFTWFSGIMILLISMMTAFLGYVLPWGQMSFWAATVITNLLSVIPFFGKMIVNWIWGGFSVSYPTLNRFFSFHFILPMVMFLFIFIHIIFLHMNGSSNTISSPLNLDKISFDPFFSSKDLIGLFVFFFLFLLLMFVYPFYSMDEENFIEANPLVTPIHIKPEWYFLFSYAILRSIPSKLGGVVCLVMSILIFLIKPFQNFKMKLKFNFFKKVSNFLFFHTFLMLLFLGAKMIDYPFDYLSLFYSFMYFLLVLFI